MIRIIIGPDPIKKDGLDRVTKSLVKQMHRLKNEKHCEVLFLTGVTTGDIHYMMRHILRILDMALTIMTQVNPDDINEGMDQQGNELKVTIKVT
ncbi:hypothetical protein C6501_06025 [Candidatus Poribacteria bacterium]|nr:MAG: hypothetical protein C6501_06025 [Candidatus Poribacteria bacterium]